MTESRIAWAARARATSWEASPAFSGATSASRYDALSSYTLCEPSGSEAYDARPPRETTRAAMASRSSSVSRPLEGRMPTPSCEARKLNHVASVPRLSSPAAHELRRVDSPATNECSTSGGSANW